MGLIEYHYMQHMNLTMVIPQGHFYLAAYHNTRALVMLDKYNTHGSKLEDLDEIISTLDAIWEYTTDNAKVSLSKMQEYFIRHRFAPNVEIEIKDKTTGRSRTVNPLWIKRELDNMYQALCEIVTLIGSHYNLDLSTVNLGNQSYINPLPPRQEMTPPR